MHVGESVRMRLIVAAVMLLVLSSILAVPAVLIVQPAQMTRNTQTSLTVRTDTDSGIIIRPCDPGSGGGGEGVIDK